MVTLMVNENNGYMFLEYGLSGKTVNFFALDALAQTTIIIFFRSIIRLQLLYTFEKASVLIALL